MSDLHPPWLAERPVRRLLHVLDAAGLEARFVGGCVRDALLGIAGGDIDIATPTPPDAVTAALRKARVKVVPTGIAHGTVTAIVASRPFEITTLRRDVETDGRHAKVAFDAGWEEDAARRDFTINAMYLSSDGTLFDPTGGQADLAAHRVRFVGDPATRIEEDVLRVLRYYRFEARFGSGEGDASARAACRVAVGKLPALSAERVWRELSRLLAGPDPVRVLTMMHDDGVLAAILPEATRLDRLGRLSSLALPSPTLPRMRGRERVSAGGGFASDCLLRLAALVDVGKAGAVAVAERLRLSNVERNRLARLTTPWPIDPDAGAKDQRLALYRLGRERYRDLALLASAEGGIAAARLPEMLQLAENWTPLVFPLGGGDVSALGIAPSPRTGKLLAEVKSWWEDGDFTADRGACLAKLKELVARL